MTPVSNAAQVVMLLNAWQHTYEWESLKRSIRMAEDYDTGARKYILSVVDNLLRRLREVHTTPGQAEYILASCGIYIWNWMHQPHTDITNAYIIKQLVKAECAHATGKAPLLFLSPSITKLERVSLSDNFTVLTNKGSFPTTKELDLRGPGLEVLAVRTEEEVKKLKSVHGMRYIVYYPKIDITWYR